MEIINIGPTSLNCDMAFHEADETRGELWLTDLPKLGLFLVGGVSCVKMSKMVVKSITVFVHPCIDIPRHVICRFEDAAFLDLLELHSEGWRIRNLLTFRVY